MRKPEGSGNVFVILGKCKSRVPTYNFRIIHISWAYSLFVNSWLIPFSKYCTLLLFIYCKRNFHDLNHRLTSVRHTRKFYYIPTLVSISTFPCGNTYVSIFEKCFFVDNIFISTLSYYVVRTHPIS